MVFMFVLPPNSYFEILNPEVMVLRSGAFRKWLGHEGKALMLGLLKEALENSSAMWIDSEKKATCEQAGLEFSSVAQSCPTLCDPMDCSLPVHYQLPEFTQTHVHWVGDAIKSSHPLSSPSPLALNLSQHRGLFKWVSSSHQVAKVFEFQPQHQPFQWIFRVDFL